MKAIHNYLKIHYFGVPNFLNILETQHLKCEKKFDRRLLFISTELIFNHFFNLKADTRNFFNHTFFSFRN